MLCFAAFAWRQLGCSFFLLLLFGCLIKALYDPVVLWLKCCFIYWRYVFIPWVIVQIVSS